MHYIVNGGNQLKGEIAVYGAKNCALALLGATVLTDDSVVLRNCPDIVDVENMLKLLQSMGKNVVRNRDTVEVNGGLTTTNAPQSLATLLRGSALILGSALARYHQIDLPLPGGCAIGSRPMDIHLDGLTAMGAQVDYVDSSVHCRGRIKGATYTMRFASVGATENLLCASVLAEGESVLINCATEPEVVALEQLLVKMGAKIKGIGSQIITVTGVKSLHGATFDVIADRIVTATYISATVATLGNVTVTNCCPRHLQAFVDLLRPHFDVVEYADAVSIRADKQPIGYGSVTTAPYPNFATDMQSLLLSLAAVSDGGQTVITEKLFENRLQHNAEQLKKMGAEITVNGDTATVYGRHLTGAEVQSFDLRGGAGLVVASLNARGTSTVMGIEHINRGYDNLAQNLCALGADIQVCN